jgi:hypothetical protein
VVRAAALGRRPARQRAARVAAPPSRAGIAALGPGIAFVAQASPNR